MKKLMSSILIVVLSLSLIGCSQGAQKNESEISPQVSQMKSICELATMQCYFHNVAKYTQEDAAGVLWWKKDRKFWVEYSGIVTIGIDTSLLEIDVNGEMITISLPPAKVLSCKVDENTLSEDSFIVAKDSAKVEAEHQTEAFKEAQAKMKEEAANDTLLLANAQQRAQKLLEDYVKNIGDCIGKSYQIKWIYLDGAKELSNIDVENVPQISEE